MAWEECFTKRGAFYSAPLQVKLVSLLCEVYIIYRKVLIFSPHGLKSLSYNNGCNGAPL